MKVNSIVKRILGCTAGVVGSTILLLVFEIYRAIHQPVAPYDEPSRTVQHFGPESAPALSYVVMGDSTAAGQGALYGDGIAVATAKHMAMRYHVSMVNLGVSGATIDEVSRDQLPKIEILKPDIVLISVGSNDVTHLTPDDELKPKFSELLDGITQMPHPPAIVCTGAADLGSSPRFLQPLRAIAGWRSAQVNKLLKRQADQYHAVWCPLAQITGPIFSANKSLYGQDHFHPNSAGYAVWTDAINPSLDEAIRHRFQTAH